jgi:hypothetical protein
MFFAMLMTEYVSTTIVEAIELVLVADYARMTLVWNHVNQVVAGGSLATPSQLLPLLIGVGGVVRIFYIMLKEHLEERRSNKAGSGFSPEAATLTVDLSTRPAWARYLITLLPWLSLSSIWSRPASGAVSGNEETGVGVHSTELKKVPALRATSAKSAVVTSTSHHSSRSSSSAGGSARAARSDAGITR